MAINFITYVADKQLNKTIIKHNTMTSRQTVEKWVTAFNQKDITLLESLYAEDAINHQMPFQPMKGRAAIVQMFRTEFQAAPEMFCLPVQIIEENDWAVLEWSDPKGFGGCGFFNVINDLIQTQRGYWDRMTFNKLYKIEDADIH
jgi:limonene-1,2-epoxide hydrolase